MPLYHFRRLQDSKSVTRLLLQGLWPITFTILGQSPYVPLEPMSSPRGSEQPIPPQNYTCLGFEWISINMLWSLATAINIYIYAFKCCVLFVVKYTLFALLS